MRSNYKRIGEYIRAVDLRNSKDKKDNLLGVSVSKVFIKSIANTVGTDFTSYRTVKKNQFTYIPDTSRRGDKIGIALLEDIEEGLVSQAYTVFEVVNKETLLPEYLMMWFRRPEFDRYARFISHGSVREIFEWEDMCNVALPIPHPDVQKEIVKEYNVIVNRIELNNRLIQKLEETAQAIYKQWFVDFEFPDENGSPYKSNGGEMERNEELEMEVPKGWEVGELEKIIIFKNGKTRPASRGRYPVYGGNGIVDFVDQYNAESIIAIGRVGAYCGSLYRVLDKCWISDNAICAKSKTECNMYSYYLLTSLKLNDRSEGTGQPLITQGLLNGIRSLLPPETVRNMFERKAISLYKSINSHEREADLLLRLKNLLLCKLATIEN